MAASSGRLMLVRVKNDAGAPAFVAVAGLQTKTLNLNREIVDITNSDSAGAWRELLSAGGVQSLSVSGGGVAQDKPSLVVFQDMLFDGTLRDGEVVVPGFGTLACKVAITTLTLSGEHNADIKFEMSLESSGVVTFTVEP